MLTPVALLVLIALLATLVHGFDRTSPPRLPLWVAVMFLCLAVLIQVWVR